MKDKELAAVRRLKVEDRFLQGMRAVEIAAELETTATTVNADVRALLKQWRKSIETDAAPLLAVEVAKMALVERHAWIAWNKSQQSLRRNAQTKKQAASGDTLQASTVEAEQVANSKFLALVLHCIDRRCRLLGIDGGRDETLIEPLPSVAELIKSLPADQQEDLSAAARKLDDFAAKAQAKRARPRQAKTKAKRRAK